MNSLEPRAERYDQGYSQGYAQAERDIANMLQRAGHIAASVLVANEEHRRMPTLAQLAIADTETKKSGVTE